ncbi:MAG TPA: energy transducer TonB [Gemmatimonadota bacterium]|nr:energy transducer TonB [Gemmatimonadota bacterium]
MSRPLLASAVLHLTLVVVPGLLALRGVSRPLMPPVYQVSLVSGATVAPEARRPEPRPEETVEEDEPPEPEAKEKVPDAESEREPEKTSGRPGPETPRPGPETGREAGPDLPLTLEGRPFRFPWYLGQLVSKIERHWRPASNTLRATVYFRIARDGGITDIKVAEESGNFLFDQSARRAVEASAPMPPLPSEYDGDYLGVYFDFDTRVQVR